MKPNTITHYWQAVREKASLPPRIIKVGCANGSHATYERRYADYNTDTQCWIFCYDLTEWTDTHQQQHRPRCGYHSEIVGGFYRRRTEEQMEQWLQDAKRSRQIQVFHKACYETGSKHRTKTIPVMQQSSDEIWWIGEGLYAPRNHGSVTRWYRVEDAADARQAGLGTPNQFDSKPTDMRILL